MRTKESNWPQRWLVVIGIVLMTQALSYGQGVELFSPPMSKTMSVSTITPIAGPASTQGLQSSASNSSVFGPPQFSASAPPTVGLSSTPVGVATPVAATVSTQNMPVYVVGNNASVMPSVPTNQVMAYQPAPAYQQAGALWQQGGQTTPAASPIQAYVVTNGGVQPVGCSGSALSGVDLSNLNPDGCSSDVRYTVAPAPVSCGCGSKGCGGGTCGLGGCGKRSCGLGGCGSKSCGLGGCGSKGCGLGGCGCGSQMQCTSAACKNCQCDSLCGCSCCRPRFWARVDALLWYMDGYATPSLLTRSPAGTPQNIAGVLGNGSTRTLFGGNDIGDNLRPGGRLRMGYWFDPCRKFGIQGDFFALGSGGDSAVFNGDGNDSFARPFFNTDPNVNAQDSQIFSRPGLAEGSVRFNTSSSVISAAPTLRWNLCCCQDPCSSNSRRVDFLLGYRFFRVEEEFASQEILRPTDGLFVAGTRYELNDRITTENEFHGVEFGVSHMYQRGQWRFDLASVFAVGEVQRSVQLDGSTRITVPGFQDNTLPGGFYVGPNDVGRYEDRDYAVLPQVRANLSYCLGCNWRLGVGYDFMYLSSMFRPDSYLNTSFDGSRLARQPVIGVVGDPPVTQKRDMFLHGVNVNLTYNF